MTLANSLRAGMFGAGLLCAAPATAQTARLAIPANFTDAMPFADGYAAVRISAGWGYLNLQGFMMLQPDYDEVTQFSDGMAAARLGEQWGYIDHDGIFQLAPSLAYASAYANGNSTFAVNVNGVLKYGVMNNHWDLITKPTWGEKLDFHDGPSVVRTMNGKPLPPIAPAAPPPSGPFKYGYINLQSVFVIPAKYDGALAFQNGLAAVMSAGKWGYVDFDGKMVIEPKFSAGGFFSENLAAEPGEGGKFGYIDKSGNFAIAARFDEARQFSEARAAVKLDGKWGFIDTSGKFTITPQFADAREFSQGMAPVKVGELWGYVRDE